MIGFLSTIILGVFAFFLMLAAVVAVPLIIGVYVYKDAAGRGMPALPWALVAAFVPFCIGLIIYLFMRTDQVGRTCPRCHRPFAAHLSTCPNCGYTDTHICPNCRRPVQAGWAHCPNCGQTLHVERDSADYPYTPYGYQQKTSRGWIVLLILAGVILLLLAVLVAIIGPHFAFSTGGHRYDLALSFFH